MQKPAPALLFIPYSAIVKIHIWRLTVHSSSIILFYFDRLYKPFFPPFLSFPRFFFSLLHFFPSLRCALPLSWVADLGLWGCRSGLGVIEPWVWLWGCRSGLDVVVELCDWAVGVVVCVLVSAWWWSRGCGCGVADLSLGVVVCDLVSAWWWSCGCGCGVAGGLRREARNEEREKKFK